MSLAEETPAVRTAEGTRAVHAPDETRVVRIHEERTAMNVVAPAGDGPVYRFALRRRSALVIVAVLVTVLLGAIALHAYQLRAAERNVRQLQQLTTEQQSKLQAINKQADDLTNQLRAVQRENAEIKRLIGADRGRRHAMLITPGRPHPAGFAALQARLKRLARASAATRADAEGMRRLAMRVLNLRRMASIARERMMAMIPSLNPVGGAIASGFGWRTDPWPEFHKGLDLEADYGTPVHASAAGTVASAGWDGGFGIKVDIDHGNGYHSWYAHLSHVSVTAGEHVTKGQQIALSGSSGESTGPHLHYQVMYEGQAIDPQPFLSGIPPKVLATLPDAQGV